MDVRSAEPSDADGLWQVLEPVVREGETFAHDPDAAPEEVIAGWMASAAWCFVAEEEGRILGSYVLKANQPCLGAHVANASYAVHPDARGRGLGRELGKHSMEEARRLGFRAMQFNLVVSTNEGAIALWRSLGFEVAGRLPRAFHLRGESYVDALVMFRSLEEADEHVHEDRQSDR